jgi:hypothetical protein
MDLIIALAHKLKVDVMSLSRKEIEAIENAKLLEMPLVAKDEGLADTQEVLTKLGTEYGDNLYRQMAQNQFLGGYADSDAVYDL